MAGHALIDAHLAHLAHDLPAEAVEELADGLTETYEHHIARGLEPTAAAAAAITDFGDPGQIATAFTRHAPGRRSALALLATGPVLAACWAPSLIAARAWTWPLALAVGLSVGLALLLVVGMLIAAATSRRYHRTRLGGPAAAGLVVLDATAVALALLAAPTLVWPMAIAIPASLIRIALTTRALPHLLARG